MVDRPATLWKRMAPDVRVRAAEAFWRDRDSPEIALQQAEAAAALAKRLNFRVKTVRALPVDRRARHLAQLGDVSDSVALRALVAYHFADRRELMGAFLDALGIAHEAGLITAEEVPAPDRAAIESAAAAVRERFAAADVDLYLRTLAALDDETWAHVAHVLEAPPA